MRRKTRLRASRAIEGWFGSPGVRRYVALAERRSGKWTVRCADPQASNSSDEGVRSSFRKNGRHRVVPDFPSLNRLEVGAARPRLRRVRYRVGELASHQQHGDQAVSEERLFGSTAPPVLCQGAGNKVPLSLRRESKQVPNRAVTPKQATREPPAWPPVQWREPPHGKHGSMF